MKQFKLPNGVAEVQITYSSNVPLAERIKVVSSRTMYEIIKPLYGGTIEYCESFKIALLNRANHLLGVVQISEGGLSGTDVDIRKIFQAALKANAQHIILSHNHPSGALVASAEDKGITKRIAEAGKILNIAVIDHLIVTNDGYLSFGDEGIL